MVASCAGAALGCYLVSLRVASERAALENVETQIVLAQRDIRLLQTEIGTRGRLAQLERWNVKVLALSAPSADQFLDGGFALAKMVAPRNKVDLEAPVVLASAPANGPKPRIQGAPQPQTSEDEAGVSPKQMMYTASLTRHIKPAVDRPVAERAPIKPELPPAKRVAEKAKPAAAKVKPTVVASASAKPKPTRLAHVDPLAPKPDKPVSAKSISGATTKDSGSNQ
jgi:hypothetical protein